VKEVSPKVQGFLRKVNLRRVRRSLRRAEMRSRWECSEYLTARWNGEELDVVVIWIGRTQEVPEIASTLDLPAKTTQVDWRVYAIGA